MVNSTMQETHTSQARFKKITLQHSLSATGDLLSVCLCTEFRRAHSKRRTDEVAGVPAHVSGVLIVGAHFLGAEAQRRRGGARVAEAAGAQPDAAQPRQALDLPAA